MFTDKRQVLNDHLHVLISVIIIFIRKGNLQNAELFNLKSVFGAKTINDFIIPLLSHFTIFGQENSQNILLFISLFLGYFYFT